MDDGVCSGGWNSGHTRGGDPGSGCGWEGHAIANVGGEFHAIDNTCLHRGGPLGDGPLEGKIVTCPWHGWQYDVTTGKIVQNPSVGVACYAVEVRGAEVFVDLG